MLQPGLLKERAVHSLHLTLTATGFAVSNLSFILRSHVSHDFAKMEKWYAAKRNSPLLLITCQTSIYILKNSK